MNTMMTPKAERRTAGRLAGTVLACALALLLPACQGLRPENWSPQEHSAPPLVAQLAPGDVVEISFLGAPDLNTTQTIRRDGNIALRIVGEVTAAGKTPAELRREIAALYGSQLQIKEVTVLVKSAAPVFVGGAVLRPGRVPTDRPLTALEAIMECGGFNAMEAEVRNVVVIRHEGGKRRGYCLNLQPALQGDDGDAFYLRPFDIVYVPRTRIAKVDQWVEQHINRIIPRLGLGYSTSGDVTFYR